MFPPRAPNVNPLPIIEFLANTTQVRGCIITSVGLYPLPINANVKSKKSSTDNVSLYWPSFPKPVVPAAGWAVLKLLSKIVCPWVENALKINSSLYLAIALPIFLTLIPRMSQELSDIASSVMLTLTPIFLTLISKVAFSIVVISKLDSLYLVASPTSYAVTSPITGTTYTAEFPPSTLTVLKNLVPKYSGSAASLNFPSITFGINFTTSVDEIASWSEALPFEKSPCIFLAIFSTKSNDDSVKVTSLPCSLASFNWALRLSKPHNVSCKCKLIIVFPPRKNLLFFISYIFFSYSREN